MLSARPSSSASLCARCLRRYATVGKSAQKGAPKKSAPIKSFEPAVVTDNASVQKTSAPLSSSAGILRVYKPRTPGLRHLKRPINDHLWKGEPYKQLTFPKKGQGRGGRNNRGRITTRHRGGGHKRRIRMVDFQRISPGAHSVERIEYDPNRSSHIALLTDQKTKDKSYIVAAEGMRAGDTVQSYRAGIPSELLRSMGGVIDPGVLATKTALRGNCLPIRLIPVGTQIYCVGSQKDKGAVFCRSAGTYAIIVSKDETRRKVKEVAVRLQSGEVRKVDPEACATIGIASNPNFHFRQLGKAGRARWLGRRPTVRGVAQNACSCCLPIMSLSVTDSEAL